MLFHVVFTAFLIFIIVWAALRFIFPKVCKEDSKETIDDVLSEKLKEEAELLKKLNDLKEELVVTKDLKNVVTEVKNVSGELKVADDELKNLKG